MSPRGTSPHSRPHLSAWPCRQHASLLGSHGRAVAGTLRYTWHGTPTGRPRFHLILGPWAHWVGLAWPQQGCKASSLSPSVTHCGEGAEGHLSGLLGALLAGALPSLSHLVPGVSCEPNGLASCLPVSRAIHARAIAQPGQALDSTDLWRRAAPTPVLLLHSLLSLSTELVSFSQSIVFLTLQFWHPHSPCFLLSFS